MRKRKLALALCLEALSSAGSAQQRDTVPVSHSRQLSGLSSNEADLLLVKLKDAQRRLKAGEFQSFDLLTGSIASYDMTKISPREAFLTVRFDDVWDIKWVRPGSDAWRPYRLSYAPDGLGKLYWDIEVVLNFDGGIQRVEMTYKPPAPF